MSSTLTQSTKKSLPRWTNWQSHFSQKEEFCEFNSRPGYQIYAKIAQLVEHLFEAQGVGGSIPSLGTMYVGVSPRGLRHWSLKSVS